LDKRFLGSLVIIAIISTAVGMLMFARSVEAPYTILTYEYPKDPSGRGSLPTTGEKDHILLSLLVNKPLSLLSISYSYLGTSELDMEKMDQSGWSGLSMMEKASRVGLIPDLIDMQRDLSMPLGWSSQSYELKWGARRFDMVVYDFSNYTAWVGGSLPGLPVLHGVLFDESGNLTGYFTGSPGFLGWKNAVLGISVARGGEETKYAPERKGVQQEGTTPIDEAPKLGVVEFRDLRPDEIVTVDLTIDPGRLPSTVNFTNIIGIGINGRPHEVLATFFGRAGS